MKKLSGLNTLDPTCTAVHQPCINAYGQNTVRKKLGFKFRSVVVYSSKDSISVTKVEINTSTPRYRAIGKVNHNTINQFFLQTNTLSGYPESINQIKNKLPDVPENKNWVQNILSGVSERVNRTKNKLSETPERMNRYEIMLSELSDSINRK